MRPAASSGLAKAAATGASVTHGTTSARVVERRARRASTVITSAGSLPGTICGPSPSGSMRPSSRLSAHTSNQVADRHSTKAPKRRRARTRSMSVSARSETLSPVPPSRRSMTSSTRMSSAVMIIFVSPPAVSTTAATDDSGTDSMALAKVNWPASMTSSSTSRRCSALSRVAAEAQKTSMMRRRRRCWSMPNLLGRLKSTVRSQRVRRPWPLSELSTGGRPLLA